MVDICDGPGRAVLALGVAFPPFKQPYGARARAMSVRSLLVAVAAVFLAALPCRSDVREVEPWSGDIRVSNPGNNTVRISIYIRVMKLLT